MSQFTETCFIRFQTTVCCTCGVQFAMTEYLQQKRLNNGGLFYCPNGHSMSYNDPKWKQIQKQLEATQVQLRASKRETANERNLRLEVEAEKAKLGQKLKRVDKGVCPCCNRSFNNLARHMKSKHADAQAKK